jgi:hypothetical protein
LHISKDLQLEIDKAHAAQARYTQHNDIQGLNEAIEIWEGILNHPELFRTSQTSTYQQGYYKQE